MQGCSVEVAPLDGCCYGPRIGQQGRENNNNNIMKRPKPEPIALGSGFSFRVKSVNSGTAPGQLSINPRNAFTDYSTLHEMSFIPTPGIGIYEDPFRFLSTDIKKVTGLRDTGLYPNNTYLCHFGRSTYKSCGFVKQINVSNIVYDPTDIQSPSCPYRGSCSSKYSPDPNTRALSCRESFNKLGSYGSSLACSKGDSGGPVYSATGKAFGIVNSASFNGPSIGQCESVTFSLIDYAVRDLGFVLKIEF